jgi:hypothetical protein
MRASFSSITNVAFEEQTIASQPDTTALIGLTSTLAPNWLGEFRLSYTRLQVNNYPESQGFNPSTLGFGPGFTNYALARKIRQRIIGDHLGRNRVDPAGRDDVAIERITNVLSRINRARSLECSPLWPNTRHSLARPRSTAPGKCRCRGRHRRTMLNPIQQSPPAVD